MADPQKALETQLRNIQARTGQLLDQLVALIKGSGLATNARVEPGLNIKVLPDSPRLEKLPAGQMCNHRVKLTEAKQVDAEIAGWIKRTYDAAG